MISRYSTLWVGVLMSLCALAHAASTVETYQVNLNPLIDKAMHRPTQFAVGVARRVNSETSGRWQFNSGDAVWDYSIRIPTAVSMGFHASRLLLPSDGTVTVSGGGQSFKYHARDLHRAEFWSQTVKGDQIAIHVTVPARKRHQTLMEIAEFQAGYKSLVPGMADNAHYKSMRAHTSAASADCVQNYACNVTASNQNAANASVALVISNQFECSGTILNDVPQDGAPYVLTARHCENGEPGGGNPGAASSVQVYWGSVTACGQSLVSIFDSYAQVQSGGTTVVEQQDEWLIRLDTLPTYAGVYYAGWDASGAALNGGYSIDYSSAETQQYVTWAGDAITETLSAQTLGVAFSSTYWGVVNSLGSVDYGASGSALFNGNNAVVGSASRAVVSQCPVTPPPTPSTNSVVALYNQLASTWSSTADTSSTTGSTTIASTLDPANTGTLTLGGVSGVPVTASIQVSQESQQVNADIQLQFQGSLGAVCTATGGVAGDGWSGTLNAYPSGSVQVAETASGTVTYGITCVNGTRSQSAHVSVTWSLAAPVLTFFDEQYVDGLYPGVVNTLAWRSNQSSCLPTGGAAGDGWSGTLAGSGQADVTENLPGTYVYTLTCGTGSQAISQSLTVKLAAPTASITLTDLSGLLYGQTISLLWSGTGGCTASGGGAGDGWAGALTGTSNAVYLAEQSPGTYVYTITCGPAAVAAVAQATYTFTSGAPAASLTASQPTEQINLAVQTIPDLLTWTSNVWPCGITYTGPANGTDLSGFPSQGSDTNPQEIAGLYTYTLACGLAGSQTTSTATIQWTQQPSPYATLSTESGNEFPLSGGYLMWTTNVMPCIGSGGAPGDGWNGQQLYYDGPLGRSAQLITESVAGTYTFTITCGVGTVATASVIAVYNNDGGSVLTLAPGTSQTVNGQPTYLTWNSAVGPCTGYGGSSSDGWNGSHPQKGSSSVVENVGADYTLSLVCGTGSAAVEVQTEIADFGPASDVTAQLIPSNTLGTVGTPITLQWTGNQAASCTATGGSAGDGWTGNLRWFGSMTVTETQSGSVTYGLTCQNGSLNSHGSATVQWSGAPSVTLTSSTTNGVLGTPFTLTWSAVNGATECSASEDGGQGGIWKGALNDSGSMSIQESSGTTHTYAVACAIGNVQSQVTVTFSPASGSGSSTTSSSGGKSGGGSLSPPMIGLLFLLVVIRWARRALGAPISSGVAHRRSSAPYAGSGF
jgi:lysyl endopeptidase